MAEEKGKSNLERYNDVKALLDKTKNELGNAKRYDAKGNEMKSYINLSEKLNKIAANLDELSKTKDDVTLSEGAKTHLMDIYISEIYGRNTEIENKYIKKGLMVEEDGITIYSRIKKVFFAKNETRLKNSFIQGTPDSFVGASIHEAERVPDIKCSWNAYTFYRTFIKDMNSIYYWQGMGYMWLTGAKYFDLAYCLVNTPESLIEAEKRSLWYKLGQPEETNGNFIDACAELEKSLTYDDIPLHERMLEYTIERNDADIELLKKKILAARKYLNQLHIDLTTKFNPSLI
ncbi:MAG TPA: hypothetical protein VN922_17045 [Bacteroidia bacterium]|nr:hypothetical protein [Bacteroidia bacterium]